MQIEIKVGDYSATTSRRNGKVKVDHCSSLALVGSKDPLTVIGTYLIFLLKVQAAIFDLSLRKD